MRHHLFMLTGSCLHGQCLKSKDLEGLSCARASLTCQKKMLQVNRSSIYCRYSLHNHKTFWYSGWSCWLWVQQVITWGCGFNPWWVWEFNVLFIGFVIDTYRACLSELMFQLMLLAHSLHNACEMRPSWLHLPKLWSYKPYSPCKTCPSGTSTL